MDAPTVPEGKSSAPGPIAGPAIADMTAPDAPGAAKADGAVDQSNLEVVSRTERSTTFKRSDGATVQQLSPTPINARDAKGKWVDINTAVADVDGTWRVKDHPLSRMHQR